MRRLLAVAAVVAFAACKRSEPPPPPPAADAEQAARSLAAIVASGAVVQGDVQVRRAGQPEWTAVATGAVFRAGDVVRTGPGAFARIEFLAGGGLELEPEAEVLIDVVAPAAPGAAGAPAPESRVSVERGVVRGFMPATADAAPIVLRTAEGRDVRLAATPGEKPVKVRLTRGAAGTEVAVTSGEVRISGSAGATTLRSGQVTDVKADGAGDIVELLEFPASVEPGIDARFRWEPQLPIRLAWRGVAAASGYRVQVARDLAFQSVEQAFETEGTEATFVPRGEGLYAWRVASRDAARRLGEYGFARRIYLEKEQPKDLLVGPADGHTIRFADQLPPIEFTWQSSANAAAYRLVVARGPDLFGQKVMELETSGQRLEIVALESGTYYWGVYVKDLRAPQPIFVKPRQLVLQKVAKPKVTVPKAIREWGK
ncbi:MAG TPA: hypothetical protein VFL83_01960 [Anaeromyxobacter sp.]|nr:hypothetical protein [Anaeromyxobacter sp.]